MRITHLIVFVAALAAIGCQPAPQPTAATTATKTGTVTLEVNAAEEQHSFQIEDVADGTTLEALMRSFTDVAITVKGSGTTAFVESIGDQATGATEGWTFKVDGEWSDKGIGKTVLHPPTTITWNYGDFEPEG